MLALLATAPLPIQIHLATVLPAFAIGTWLIFFSAKGSRRHRTWGAAYLTLMTITAIDTLFIRSINNGGLSVIHLFVPLTLFGVVSALWHARRGNISGHRRAMYGLYVGGILIAGSLSFMPDRFMNQLSFA